MPWRSRFCAPSRPGSCRTSGRYRRRAPDPAVAGGTPLPVPETLGALVEARIGTLPVATRSALLLAAVAAEPSIHTLRRADPTAPAALERAFDAGIASLDRRSIRFA